MAEYERKNLVYEKEDLLISGTGKYPGYNFYKVSGMEISGKKKGEAENERPPVDVRSSPAVNIPFVISALVAVAATAMVITRRSAVHALFYLVVSLLAVAVIMYILGGPFVAALEVIIYAGAIMVLFVFVIMLIGHENVAVPPRSWIGPSLLARRAPRAARPGCWDRGHSNRGR